MRNRLILVGPLQQPFFPAFPFVLFEPVSKPTKEGLCYLVGRVTEEVIWPWRERHNRTRGTWRTWRGRGRGRGRR